MLCLDEDEKLRLQKMLVYEQEAYQKGFRLIAGVDEAGRGPLAGPVVAAACILPKDLLIAGIDDSKKLTSQKRKVIFEELKSNPSVTYAIGIVDSTEIDRLNIYKATILAMWQAVNQLATFPDCLLVDGMELPQFPIECYKIFKGDQLSLSIAAASIIAKETRDEIMRKFHQEWPLYGFDQHKGYGTPQHLSALENHGPCPIHRFSFEPVRASGECAVRLSTPI